VTEPSEWPLVSVAVPTWNRADYLEVCLASLLDQDYPKDTYEILVVDDGSTDRTSDLVRSVALGNEAPPIRYVRQEHQSLNAARNTAIRNAQGAFVCFVDDDIYAPRSWLTRVTEGVLRHPTAGCLGGPILTKYEGKPPRLCGREGLPDAHHNRDQGEGPVSDARGANMVVTKKGVETAGMFDERLRIWGDEVEWQQRLVRNGGQIIYLPEAWLWHRRTRHDLRLLTVAKRWFGRGLSEAAFVRVTGMSLDGKRLPAAHRLRRIPRLLGHAVRRRCTWGLAMAFFNLGHIWAEWRQPKDGPDEAAEVTPELNARSPGP
jgi:glycosyltransferase involved in cell wall biosynthesis